MAENTPEPIQKKIEKIEVEKPIAEQTFLGNDVFKTIKEKYMRDSMQYSRDENIGMSSMSEISQSVIHNKETKLGIMQQSLKSSYGSLEF